MQFQSNFYLQFFTFEQYKKLLGYASLPPGLVCMDTELHVLIYYVY